MQHDTKTYQHILDCIPPSATNRQQWIEIGMAIKHENLPFEMWDAWSAGDYREKQYQGTDYNQRIWDGFEREGSFGTVTGATLTEYARTLGTDPFPKFSQESERMDWDSMIVKYEEPERWNAGVEDFSVSAAPSALKPSRKKEVFQIIEYLEALFEPDDHPCIMTQSEFNEKDGRFSPKGAGVIQFTARELIESMRAKADKPDWFDEVFGSYNHKAGVWVRINPVKGKLPNGQYGIKDADITSFRHCLIECDAQSPQQQIEMYRQLQLPYKALVYSGNKSVHAVVRIDGKSYADWKNRVEWLYSYCLQEGVQIDGQCKNPSRLSRLPGVERGEQKQFLIETAAPQSFDEWKALATAKKDSEQIPFESFEVAANDMPELAPELIEGFLREGHKATLSGPSKAGKSFWMIECAVAIAEGREWIGMKCTQGAVLYLNLEVDARSFRHRVKSVYDALHWPMANTKNLDIIDLRGKCEPLDRLLPKLEFLVKRRQYKAIIIDPIYKIITGDENSASDMSYFTGLLDRLADVAQAAVMTCHHFSKGTQAHKSAIDRASGSGVWGRDGDAITAMTPLELTEFDRKEVKARMIEQICDAWLKKFGIWEKVENPDLLSDRIWKQDTIDDYFVAHPAKKAEFEKEIETATITAESPPFRVTFSLREFPTPKDINVFFVHPVHIVDPTGYLNEMFLEGDNSYEKLTRRKEIAVKKRADERRDWYEEKRKAGIIPTIQMMMDEFGITRQTARNWVKTQPDLYRDNGTIYRNNEGPKTNTDSKN